MKRSIIILFFILLFFELLSGNLLIDVYHHNYGIIDRTVLVFDSKPDYSISNDEKKILISAFDTRKLPEVKTKKLAENKVLSEFNYSESLEKLDISIVLNHEYQRQKGHQYSFSTIELPGEFFKLVFDIFANYIPTNEEERKSFISFYEKMGKDQKAEEYRKLDLAEISRTIPEKPSPKASNNIQKQEIHKTEKKSISKKPEQTIKPAEKKKEIVKKYSEQDIQAEAQKATRTFNNAFLLFSIGNILVVIVYFAIKKFRNKNELQTENWQETKSTEKEIYHPTEGFGDVEFQKEMIKKLVEEKWDPENIAREMNLTEERVKQLIMPQFSEHERDIG